MARDYAQIRLDMWGDDDFRDLTPAAQHLYLTLLTEPTLSYCGVADWRPSRIASKAKGWTPTAVNAAAAELARALFVIVDEATEEVLVRSFVKHDGLMKNPRMAVSMLTAYAGVASKTLRGVVVFEIAKLRDKRPELTSWASPISGPRLDDMLRRESIDPAEFPTGFPYGDAFVTPIGEGSVSPSVKGSITPKPTPWVKGSTSPAPTPAPTPSTSNEVLEESAPRERDAAPTEKPARGIRLPDDWMPPRELIEKMRAECPDVDLESEHRKFSDYWAAQTGARATKAGQRGWEGTWRNWIRRAAESAPANRPRTLSFRERQFEDARKDFDAARAAGDPDPFDLLDSLPANIPAELERGA
ncbi:hypothetical protein [Rhodococcus opacus]|uniref:hypothetical protein n=1 Tax=Rhodococcus opacus TaxID=37919 RepID=UPI001C47606A|nr:hypothetical protein [Rhodococcus opacus]MBV6758412.1 hypothetical protein [Rhodococcus opacus]